MAEAALIDGKAFAASLRARIGARAADFMQATGRRPGLAVVLVGDDPASQVYVGAKARACEEAGIASFEHRLPAETSEAELLASHTGMDICEAAEGMAIYPNAIYICPPGHFMAIRFGVLHLTRPFAGDHIRLPIDFLVRSLAEECGPRSVCIILTGTGNDGSGALPALHASGGRILVQDPDEAEYDGMPRAAVLTGLADAVVPLAAMPKALAKILLPMAGAASNLAAAPEGDGTADIQSIIALLQQQVGQDFSAYKRGTLERRIHRDAWSALVLRRVG
mgnify:CR=1 FL=1